jgi:hypothetical protein
MPEKTVVGEPVRADAPPADAAPKEKPAEQEIIGTRRRIAEEPLNSLGALSRKIRAWIIGKAIDSPVAFCQANCWGLCCMCICISVTGIFVVQDEAWEDWFPNEHKVVIAHDM